MEIRTVRLLNARESDREYIRERKNLQARLRYAQSPEKSRLKAKKYNAKHREEKRLYKLLWRKNNKVRHNAYQREYWWSHKVQESA